MADAPPTRPADPLPRRKSDFSLLKGDKTLSDVTIRVRIKPAEADIEAVIAAPAAAARAEGAEAEAAAEAERGPAKRARTDGGGGGGVGGGGDDAAHTAQHQEQQDDDTGLVATIWAHAAVLVQRSGYFKGLVLGGGAHMADGRAKTVTVEVEDAQEAADFERLIQLSYTASYTEEEDGRRLSKEELLRLLMLANAYEMVMCVEESAQALRPFDGYDDALAYFCAVPDSVSQLPLLQPVTAKAGDALAAALGPVEELWRPLPRLVKSRDADVGLTGNFLLDERVAAMPINAIEAVLRSEHLELKTENTTLTLALSWASEQPGTEEERQRLFNRLLKSLRYARMSALFLAAAVKMPLVLASGMVPDIVWRGFSRRDEFKRQFPLQLPPSRVAEADEASYRVTFSVEFGKADVEAMGAGSVIWKPAGILHGLTCFILMKRFEDYKFGVAVRAGLTWDEDDALSTQNDPCWPAHDDDARSRAFENTSLRVTIGQQTTSRKSRLYTSKKSASLVKFLENNELDYDEDGKLQVELEIEIKQHKKC